MVVRDRNDDDKVVVCVRHHGKYQWDVMNGTDNVSRHIFIFLL